MYKISYRASFVRKYDKLEEQLREEIKEKVELLKDRRNHIRLRVHKLHGELAHVWSFSVNYRIRVVFRFDGKEISLLNIGDHDVYK